MTKRIAVQDFVNRLHDKTIKNVTQENICNYMQELNYNVSNSGNIKYLSTRYQNKAKKNRNELLEQLINELSNKQEMLIQENLNNQINELQLTETNNPNYMVSNTGIYYHLIDNEYVADNTVINIDDNGNYTVKTKITGFSGVLSTTYNTVDEVVSFKMINNNGEPYRIEKFVAKKLNMKEEYVNKYKLRGYSGNSSGIIGLIGNTLFKPVPTGCYLSKNFKFFKWNKEYCQFEMERRDGQKVGSPLLADYDVKEDIVIRTDYDGAGIVL